MEWRKVKLGEIAEFKTGKLNSNAAVEGGKYPFFTCAPTPLSINEYAFDQQAILLAGNNAEGNFALNYYNGKFNAYQRTYVITPLNNTDIKYLYYSLSICLKNFKVLSQGTSTRFLTMGILSSFDLSLPPLPTQRRIAAILSSLDAQIENNNRINRNLEAQAQALFKSWFVDFAPWGGVMPEGWKEGNIYDVAEILDKKRVPLSGMEREKMKKIYPYYGATSIMDYVEKYIFDGRYTLLGEDGSVVKEDGTPYVQYVWGKFWVNNHAHVLIGKNGFSTELLYVWLKQINIIPLVTGAVQAKLSQSNMQKMHITIPDDEFLQKICSTLDGLFAQIRTNTEANLRLASLRDTLLPKLMKGEIEV